MAKIFAQNPEGPSLTQQARHKMHGQDATSFLTTSCPVGIQLGQLQGNRIWHFKT